MDGATARRVGVDLSRTHDALVPPDPAEARKLILKEEAYNTPSFGFRYFWHQRHDQPRTSPGILACRLCKPGHFASSQTAAPPPAATASLSNKQPNTDPTQWQYANFIPTPPVDQIPLPAGPSDFTSPIGGTPRSSRSKTPPRSTTPQRTRFSQGRSAAQTDIRRGSPVPQPRATASTPFLPQPSHPPPTQQPPAYYAPQMTAPPPASHYTTPPPPVPYAPPTPSASIPPVAHAWPAPYPTPKPAPPSLHISQPAPQANVGQQQVYHLPNPQQHRGHVPLHAENYDPANDPWNNYGAD